MPNDDNCFQTSCRLSWLPRAVIIHGVFVCSFFCSSHICSIGWRSYNLLWDLPSNLGLVEANAHGAFSHLMPAVKGLLLGLMLFCDCSIRDHGRRFHHKDQEQALKKKKDCRNLRMASWKAFSSQSLDSHYNESIASDPAYQRLHYSKGTKPIVRVLKVQSYYSGRWMCS